MKRIMVALVAVLLVASTAFAATYLLGTRPHPATGNKYRTTWANPASTPSGLMNATGATTAYGVTAGCDTASVKFGSITGTDIMNIAVQVADLYGPQYGASPPSDGSFTNAIGTDSEPWHQLVPIDSDTYKFDMNSRQFSVWRLNCLAGCDLTNSVALAWGDCWMAGQGGK